MKRGSVVGVFGGTALSAWAVATMFWPVSYGVWDTGRSVIYLAFLAALVVVSARSNSVARAFGTVAAASLIAAIISLATYAAVTGLLAERIVQLPEFMRDYTFHGYASPARYLADKYGELLELQVFTVAVAIVLQIAVAGSAGALLRSRRAARCQA